MYHPDCCNKCGRAVEIQMKAKVCRWVRSSQWALSTDVAMQWLPRTRGLERDRVDGCHGCCDPIVKLCYLLAALWLTLCGCYVTELVMCLKLHKSLAIPKILPVKWFWSCIQEYETLLGSSRVTFLTDKSRGIRSVHGLWYSLTPDPTF